MDTSIKLSWTLFRLRNENNLQKAFEQLCIDISPAIRRSDYYLQHMRYEFDAIIPLYINSRLATKSQVKKYVDRIGSVIEKGGLVFVLSNRNISAYIPKNIDREHCLLLYGQALLQFLENLQDPIIKRKLIQDYFLWDEDIFYIPESTKEKLRFIQLFLEFEKDALVEKSSAGFTDPYTHWERISARILNKMYAWSLKQTSRSSIARRTIDLVDEKRKIGVEVVSSGTSIYKKKRDILDRLNMQLTPVSFDRLFLFILDVVSYKGEERMANLNSALSIHGIQSIDYIDFKRIIKDLSMADTDIIHAVYAILNEESRNTASDFAAYFMANCPDASAIPYGLRQTCKQFNINFHSANTIDDVIALIIDTLSKDAFGNVNNELEIVDILLSLLAYNSWDNWDDNLKIKALDLYYTYLWNNSTTYYYSAYYSKYTELLNKYSKNISVKLFEDILNYSFKKAGRYNFKLNTSLILEIIKYIQISEEQKDLLIYKYVTVSIVGKGIFEFLTEGIDSTYKDFYLTQNRQLEKNIRLQAHESLLSLYSHKSSNRYLYIIQNSSETVESFMVVLKEGNSRKVITYVDINLIDAPYIIKLSSSNHEKKITISPVLKSAYSSVLSVLKKEFMDDFQAPIISGSGFELVYLYAEDVHDLEPIEIHFSSLFDISYNSIDRTVVVKKPEKDRIPQPKGFLGNAVTNICAVVGKNGSGKSSLFELFANCPMFNQNQKQNIGKYFMIYRLHSKYYYASWGMAPSFRNEYQEIDINPYQMSKDTTLVKVSNVFDAFAFSKHISSESLSDSAYEKDGMESGNLLDLSTYTLLSKAESSDAYYHDELIRYKNYKAFAQSGRFNKPIDRFGLKKIKDGTDALSSGERARLILFSRLLSVFYVHKNHEKKLPVFPLNQNYIIMLDEAELYFHPEWQRNLVNDLCCFLDVIKEKLDYPFDNITILLSSNSPFYMSDLPGEYVQALGNTSFDKTFGQNIYNLLKDRFFMENGVVGEFAQKKINNAFDYLYEARMANSKTTDQPIDRYDLNLKSKYNEKDLSDEKKKRLQEIKYIISILGDPLTKRLLLDQMIELGIECDEE